MWATILESSINLSTDSIYLLNRSPLRSDRMAIRFAHANSLRGQEKVAVFVCLRPGGLMDLFALLLELIQYWLN